MTVAEERLWDALHGRRLNGLKFRRQHPVDQFILDFYCVEQRLAVEVDGGIHATLDQSAHDEERTAWLNAQGIRVLRVTNNEVENDLAGVLGRIVQASSPRPPSPESCFFDSGGGG
jgi:very-short-patch-repair endonuclease